MMFGGFVSEPGFPQPESDVCVCVSVSVSVSVSVCAPQKIEDCGGSEQLEVCGKV